MQQRRDHGTEQHAQKRVFERSEQVLEPLHIPQLPQHILHAGHTDEQHAEADHQGGNIVHTLALGHQHDRRADRDKQRRKGRRFQQRDPRAAVAGNITQPQNLTGHGGTDVGTHDNRNRLHQLHDAGVQKAQHHHRCGCRALDHRRHTGAQRHTFDAVVGEAFQNTFQLRPRQILKGTAQQIHAEQKHTDAAQQGQCIQYCFYIHARFLPPAAPSHSDRDFDIYFTHKTHVSIKTDRFQ